MLTSTRLSDLRDCIYCLADRIVDEFLPENWPRDGVCWLQSRHFFYFLSVVFLLHLSE